MLALQLVAGLVLLLIGGELLVRGAVAAARRIGISPLLIGLTLVGFGTSTPELVTSLQAAFADSPGIAVGNVVGSNIANILLILGLAALLFPVAVAPGPFRRDGTVLVVSQLACAGLIVYGSLARIPRPRVPRGADRLCRVLLPAGAARRPAGRPARPRGGGDGRARGPASGCDRPRDRRTRADHPRRALPGRRVDRPWRPRRGSPRR